MGTALLKPWLVASMLVLSGPLPAGQPAEAARASSAPFVPPIPLGCLVRMSCAVGLESNSGFKIPELKSIEGIDTRSPQPLQTIAPNMYVVGIRPGTNFDLEKGAGPLDALLAGATAELRQRAATPPKTRYTKEELEQLARSGPRELSEQPPEVKAQLQTYFRSSEFIDCAAAEKVLALVRSSTADSGAADIPRIILAYTRYVNSCFGRTSELGAAMQRFALIVSDWPPRSSVGIYCAGFLVASGKLLTAKHCALNRPVVGLTPPIPLELYPETYAVFPFLSQKKHSLSLTDKDRKKANFDPRRPQDDFIYLTVEGSRETDVPPFPIAAPRDWDQLNFVGSFLSLPDLDEVLQRPGAGAQFLAKAVKFDTSANCRVFKVKDKCIYHACQTVGGFSGSPLLVVSKGLVTLVGVHTGAADVQAPACGFRKAQYFPNYGVSISK